MDLRGEEGMIKSVKGSTRAVPQLIVWHSSADRALRNEHGMQPVATLKSAFQQQISLEVFKAILSVQLASTLFRQAFFDC